ncbi:MAG: cytochrome c oxidase subunit 3 [Gammaproteobacteria bacterium]|nr:cytochrome c oxidase subunit 3 [Gammaproteobacteria bacterium]
MNHASTAPQHSRYFVPQPRAWPFVLTLGLFLTIVGVGAWLENRDTLHHLPIYAGVAIAFALIFIWFRGVVRESEAGLYNAQVDRTYRWAMSWFIFSEVMFFGGFFGALFYTRVLSVPWLSGEGYRFFTGAVLWPHFTAGWPSNGPAHVGGSFEAMYPWGLPAINTVLLIASSFTVTIAHHALKADRRGRCIAFMLLTIALGATFLGLQAHEYIHAYTEQHLTLHSGVYGSTFFMLTGFHGLHVTLGTLMLIIITLRLFLGHFKPDRHFGFEGVAWYWHFVDVVWILLFTFVYVL